MGTLLLRGATVVVTMDEARRELPGGWLLVRDNLIEVVGTRADALPTADITVDVSGCVVLPGLVSAHHHLVQTLFRAVPDLQDAEFFAWLGQLYRLVGGLTDEALDLSARVGLTELLLSGCTTVADHAYLRTNDMRLDTEIAAARELGIRLHLVRGSISRGQSGGGLAPDALVEHDESFLADTERLIRTYHDPAPGSLLRIALGPPSVFFASPTAVRESIELARRYGLHGHTHFAETPGEASYCRERYGKEPLDYLAELGWLGPDIWLAHAVHLSSTDVLRLAQSGTGVAYCPTSNLRLGNGIAPIVELLRAGAPVGIGVDGSASNDTSHLLLEARMALLAQRGRLGAAALSARQALELATLGGARLLGRDDIGRLAPGLMADVVAIDTRGVGFAGAVHDPVAALVLCAPGPIRLSLVNGRVVVQEGRVLGLDSGELVARHNAVAHTLVGAVSPG